MTHEVHTTDTTFPPAMPQVSMDIGLGGVTEVIGFDYHAFYELAQQNSISDKEIARLKITFTHDDSVSFRGRYKHWPRSIAIHFSDPERMRRSEFHTLQIDELGVDPGKAFEEYTPEDALDAVVRHETGHWVNALGKRIGERQRIINAAAILSTGGLAIAGSVIAPIATREAAYGPLSFVAGFFLLYSYARYVDRRNGGPEPWRMSHEIPAYLFERDTRQHRLVHFLPKTIADDA